jgi:hypothetical protein
MAVTETGRSMEVVWTSNQVMNQKSNGTSYMQWQKSKGTIESVTDLGTISEVEVDSTQGTFTKTIDGGSFQVAVGDATGNTRKIVVSFRK